MLSNYDCINSNWFESQGGYRYEESYFGDMVDSLNPVSYTHLDVYKRQVRMTY